MSCRVRRYFRFAGFEMDRDARELHRRGERVRLQIQPFRVLEILVEKAGMVVTRDELRARIWPAKVVVDFDHGLNNAVARIRDALGDDPERPQFVETLPRVGYRFVYPAADVESEALDAVAATEGTRDSRRSRPRVLAALAALAAVVLAGTIGRDFLLASRITSVAVLPFRDLSAPADQTYLGDGIAEAVITRLAQYPELRVVSRRSADRYRDSNATVGEIGAELDVDGIVEGSYLRLGDRLRVDVRLLRVSNESHAWARSYETGVAEIFELQEQVGEELAQVIGGGQAAAKAVSVARSGNLSAYELYLQGRRLFDQRNRDALMKSLDYFRQAIDRDPEFAAAYAGLAESYVTLGGQTLVKSMNASDVRDDALDAARRALALDEQLAESHGAMGQVLDKLYPHTAAGDVAIDVHYRRAIELNPSYSTAYLWHGNFLAARGRANEAIGRFRQAMAIDPVSPSIMSRLGAALLDDGRTEEGLELLTRTIEMEPFQFNARLRLGWALAVLDRLDEAEASFAVAERITPRSYHALAGLAFVAAKRGDDAAARQLLAEFEPVAERLGTPFLPAIVHVALGDREQALAWLERAAASSPNLRNPGPFNLDNPIYDDLRGDPAFDRILGMAALAAVSSGI